MVNETNTQKKTLTRSLMAVAAIVVVAVVIILAVLLPKDDDGSGVKRLEGQWVESFPPSDYLDMFPITPEEFGVDQLYLTGNEGNRIFASKKMYSKGNVTHIDVLDYEIDVYLRLYEWNMDSRLLRGTNEQPKEIAFMIPSDSGTRVAVSDLVSVTVYEQSNETAGWAQVGSTITDTLLNTTEYNFYPRSMHLSGDGRILTVASRTWDEKYNGDEEALELNYPYVIMSFQLEPLSLTEAPSTPSPETQEPASISVPPETDAPEVTEAEWRLLSVEESIGSVVVSDGTLVFSPSGQTVAVHRAMKVDGGEWKETVQIFQQYNSYNWTLVETLVEPTPPVDDAPPMSQYGSDPKSISFSYNGEVCAIGAPNYKEVGDFSFGRVEVYQATSKEKGTYELKGQVLRPAPRETGLGKLVSLSNDGNRMATSFAKFDLGEKVIQVYEYQKDENLWYPLGNEITYDVNDRGSPEYLDISADGSRVAVAWNCDINDLGCMAVYDLTV